MDDELPTLAGLRRRLCAYQSRWDMEFVSDPQAALALVRAEPIDVVIADLLMPGVGGDALLEQVRQLAPAVMRILMTADLSGDRVVRAASVAQAFLAKPFTGETIEGQLERASALREIRVPEQLTEAIGSLCRGPMFPVNYAELVDPLYSIARSGDLAAAELLAARLFEQLRVATAMDPNPPWAAARRAAVWAEHICRCEQTSALVRVNAVVASLLYPLGFLLLARYGEDELSPPCAWDDGRGLEEHSLDPGPIAAYALVLWGFPDAVTEAVCFHRVPDRASTASADVLAATHVACAISQRLEATKSDPDASAEACRFRSAGARAVLPDLAWDYLERIGLASHVDGWLAAGPTSP